MLFCIAFPKEKAEQLLEVNTGDIYIIFMMFFLPVLLLGLCAVEAQFPRPVYDTIRVHNGQGWGDWGDSDFCPTGTFAYGFKQRVETQQGSGDDTALNSILLQCGSPEQSRNLHFGEINSRLGYWGDWNPSWQNCGNEQYLSGFRLKVESCSDCDDTAANAVQFGCRRYKNRNTFATTALAQNNDGPWGSYGDWAYCPGGSAICGMKTRVENPQRKGDDTALNDAIFYCCE